MLLVVTSNESISQIWCYPSMN